SPEDDWAKVIQLGESGQDIVNRDLFSRGVDIAPRTRELLQNTFQTFLLLTAENILDDDSRYFLDSVGWTDAGVWNARREGTVHLLIGSAQEMTSGFANVLNYWEEMDSSSRSAEDREKASHFIRLKSDIRIGSSKGLAHESVVRGFTQEARAITIRRFNLGQDETVDRYFSLAGDFANRAREDSPAWFDARLNIFEKLIWLITYAGGGDNVRGREVRLWSLFAGGVESSHAENQKWESGLSWGPRKIKPPEEFEG
ncbi:MAG: hypothetical protein WB780_16620, partial [Candidatus Acidiferrales bacterium]